MKRKSSINQQDPEWIVSPVGIPRSQFPGFVREQYRKHWDLDPFDLYHTLYDEPCRWSNWRWPYLSDEPVWCLAESTRKKLLQNGKCIAYLQV